MTEESTIGIGHNAINSGHLGAIIDRIERIEDEISLSSEAVKEVYSEAKANGFDTKIIRKIISLRKIEKAKRDAEQVILDLYLNALGM